MDFENLRRLHRIRVGNIIVLISLKPDENRSFSSLSAYNCMR